MKLTLDQPHVRLQCRDGSFWALPVEQLAAVRTAHMGGKAFYEGVDCWGDPVWIKLADVGGGAHRTAESIALTAEEDEERARRKLTGTEP